MQKLIVALFGLLAQPPQPTQSTASRDAVGGGQP